MGKRILPEPSDGSELARWESEGFRRGASNSNIVYFESPDEMYTLSVEADGPVHGYLIHSASHV